jgi:hypothetical protein
MEKIIGDFSTEVKITAEEAKDICLLGAGEHCCAFLVCGSNGFECIRMSFPTNMAIFDRLEKDDMNAKGTGGQVGCAWEEELPHHQHERRGRRMNEEDLEKKYIKKIKKIEDEDQETAHVEADRILCQLLKELGFKKLVKKYQDIPKWYA